MPTITVKDIPEDRYQDLKRSAERNHRSVSSEVIACIEHVLRTRKIKPGKVLARARQLREETVRYTISDGEFTAAKAARRL